MRPRIGDTSEQWGYVWCECFVRTSSGIHVSITYECFACGNSNLRFIHRLEDKRQIQVGIECAGILLDDSELPRLAENEVKRKEKWRIHYGNPGRCWVTVADLEAKGKL